MSNKINSKKVIKFSLPAVLAGQSFQLDAVYTEINEYLQNHSLIEIGRVVNINRNTLWNYRTKGIENCNAPMHNLINLFAYVKENQ